MFATIGLSIVYFKVLSIGTYIPMLYINYKFVPLDTILTNKFFINQEKKLLNKYPNVYKGFQYIGFGITKSTEFTTKIIIKQLQYYKNFDICHKQLSKAIIHTTISYKLLIPIYAYVSYSLAKKHIK